MIEVRCLVEKVEETENGYVIHLYSSDIRELDLSKGKTVFLQIPERLATNDMKGLYKQFLRDYAMPHYQVEYPEWTEKDIENYWKASFGTTKSVKDMEIPEFSRYFEFCISKSWDDVRAPIDLFEQKRKEASDRKKQLQEVNHANPV
ncbi:MAG: hypothetical protein HPY53_01370 [Brevinematales bacterium]|nr:hypothetical protein [Brevinematales bacterium]